MVKPIYDSPEKIKWERVRERGRGREIERDRERGEEILIVLWSMPWAWNILICSAMMMMTMITVHPFQTSSDWLWHYTYQLITVSHLPFNILFIPQVVIEHVMAHAWALSLSLSLSLSPSHTLSTYFTHALEDRHSMPHSFPLRCTHINTYIPHLSLSLSFCGFENPTHTYVHSPDSTTFECIQRLSRTDKHSL